MRQQAMDLGPRAAPAGSGLEGTVNRPSRQQDHHHNYYVASARAGARLMGILRHIKEMYVVVINSQLVVSRAGEEASGFRAISERLNDLAREAGEEIRGVNREAEAIARRAVRLFQAEVAHRRFAQARERAVAAGEAHNLDKAFATHNERLGGARQQALTALDRLERHLDGIEAFLDSANYLAVNARVEAAKTASFRSQFDSVANHIQDSLSHIRSVMEEVRADVADLQAIRE
ncbi:hypothetical protein [Thiohalorhabdus methylotrophus]|uniref:Methyl-accepting transducer domain-containing protein n=1 Tax=Thiohalorhabdus methylotrophus TaxID=3242694 RepID=A0ABV4TRX4_9GAMM